MNIVGIETFETRADAAFNPLTKLACLSFVFLSCRKRMIISRNTSKQKTNCGSDARIFISLSSSTANQRFINDIK